MAVVNEAGDKILLGRNVRVLKSTTPPRAAYRPRCDAARVRVPPTAQVAGEVLLVPVRVHRARRVVRRRGQARAVGGGRC